MKTVGSILGGRTAIVTGTSRGIGAAVARTFVEQGAQVIGVSRSEPDWAEGFGSKGDLIFQRGDINDCGTIDRIASLAGQKWGRVDVLVNNAATRDADVSLEEVTDAEWERVLQTNVVSSSRWAVRLLPLMQASESGSIVNIGSVLALRGLRNAGPYVASKHALLGLTRVQALEYARSGIRSNCVLPGAVDTEMFGKPGKRDESRRGVEAKCPLGRLAQPEEIASAVLFLASSMASYISGQAIVADGAMSVGL